MHRLQLVDERSEALPVGCELRMQRLNAREISPESNPIQRVL
jgi:hypothetical protein